jgi:hypothetical protein
MPAQRHEMLLVRRGAPANHRLILHVVQRQTAGAQIGGPEDRGDALPPVPVEDRLTDLRGDGIPGHAQPKP